MRILFACVPADGHFNPLTGLAVHLRERGHDVRWYTGPSLAARVHRLGVPFHPFRRAAEITGETIPDLFPERAALRGPALIRFDGEKIFLSNVPGYVADIAEIERAWPFDVLFCDSAFYGARPVKQRWGKHVLMLEPGWESIADDPLVPPPFLGLPPASGPARRWLYRGLKLAMHRMVDRHLLAAYNRTLGSVGVPSVRWSVFEDPVRTADTYFLNGVPGLAYPRRHPAPNTRFLGACVPHRGPAADRSGPAVDPGPTDRRTVLVSQGTVDNHDPDKLIVPTLQALRGSGFRVLVATGAAGLTRRLRPLYAGPDVTIEDWIDFDRVLPRVDVFVSNGGNGSLLAALRHGVPLVCAGLREGKNDNNVHVAHHGLGLDLRTEHPRPRDLRTAIARVIVEPSFRAGAGRVRDEIARYRPHDIVDEHLAGLSRIRRAA
jgi:UDP:flavonoid glycosyltransferase YjiC (YdhE family)